MMLLSILVAPLGIAALFVVMAWTERALDHETRPEPYLTTATLTATTSPERRPAVDVAALLDRVVA